MVRKWSFSHVPFENQFEPNVGNGLQAGTSLRSHPLTETRRLVFLHLRAYKNLLRRVTHQPASLSRHLKYSTRTVLDRKDLMEGWTDF